MEIEGYPLFPQEDSQDNQALLTQRKKETKKLLTQAYRGSELDHMPYLSPRPLEGVGSFKHYEDPLFNQMQQRTRMVERLMLHSL